MSSFTNAHKSYQKTHRERHQPSARADLGNLEKKKDYKLRAQNYQQKKNTLKALRRKALDKNPDEFYFKMINTKMEDGVHQTEDDTPKYTDEQLKLMKSQDIKYVNFKRSSELKKIERLQSSLHMLDSTDKPPNKHTFFVDSKREAKNFDVAKRLDTHPALLGRRYNRPTTAMLKDQSMMPQLEEKELKELSAETRKKYKELSKRMAREKELHIIAQKLEMRKRLMDKKEKRMKISEETPKSAAIVKWTPNRKR